MWVLQHHSAHVFDMSIIIVFVYLRLQFTWNQLSSNNSHRTSCIHNGSHAGKWPDLMTSKPDSVSTTGQTTLKDHWSHNYTGMPLEPHWLPTILSPVAFQCTLGSKFQAHWIVTGRPLEDHRLRVRVFLCDIFSGARGMLKSLRNHEAGSVARRHQLSQPTRSNGGLQVRADAEENKISHDD